MNTLYIIPTPIGNLEDMTLRALRTLRECVLIACEDTRHSRVLLDHYEIRTPVTSYHEHNKVTKLDHILAALTRGDVALISDAGTPTISDPGYELVRAALDAGVKVVPLPGPNAAITALSGSGLPTDAFTYLGFPPRRPAKLREWLRLYAAARETLIFYESPHRLVETLTAMLEVYGDRQAVAAVEITKLFEGFFRGPISTLIAHFGAEPPRGEVTLLVAGQPEPAPAVWDEDQVREALANLLEKGLKRAAAAKQIAQESGWERQAIYDLDV